MLRLIYAFVEIALSSTRTGALPASRFFFALVLALYIAVALFTIQFADGVTHPYALVAVQGTLGIAFTWCLLRAFERQHRFLQTASALLGADALMSLVSLLVCSVASRRCTRPPLSSRSRWCCISWLP